MQKPVFLSVGGQRDAAFAKRVHQHLGDALAYHYQVTGAETVEFRSEIEAQISGCHVFVVFWSADYLASQHACTELAYFRKLVESQAAEKKMVVVQCDRNGPDIQSKWTNPITQKSEEYVLGKWRNERAVDSETDDNHVAQLIRRKLEQLKVLSDVLIPRGWLIDQFKREIAQPDHRARELVFVTGLEGDGRRTALRQFILQAYPHRLERHVTMDSVDGPDDLLIHLMDVASLSTISRQSIFDGINNGSSTVVKEIRKLLHQARNNKSYYVIAIDRFVGVDTVTIPTWLSEVMSVFKTGNSPLVFVVTSSPITDALLAYYPGAGRVRVPGLEDGEISELVHRLTLEDPSPTRWNLEKKQLAAVASGSSPAMCKSIMRSMACEPTLDFVDEIARRAEVDFGQSLASLMAHWVDFYANKRSDLLALSVIEKLRVASKEALDEIMQPAVEAYGEFDLYTMRDQGLVEQLSDGIYRIPPLVQRRLGDALWGKLGTAELDKLFSAFSKKVFIAESEYGAIYASNAVAASIRTDKSNIAPEYERYLTISTLFKAGLDKYSNGQWASAHRTLQRAMSRLINKTSVVDLTTEIEIARFSGLAAARQSEIVDMEAACSFLETRFSNTKRARSAAAMAKFVRGFRYRLEKNYRDAIEVFQEALQLLQDQRSVERQRAAIYTELTTAYLRAEPPQYERALKMARAAFAEKDVTHTLNALVHALILYVYRSENLTSQESISTYMHEIERSLSQLEIRCLQNGQGFHAKRTEEYQRERKRWENRTGNSSPTLDERITPVDLDYL
jgi:tetratricopeptide (TPR) repeat protein